MVLFMVFFYTNKKQMADLQRFFQDSLESEIF